MDDQIPPVPPVPPVSPTPWFKISLIIIGVLIALGLFGNLYFLAKNQKPPAEIIPTPTPIASTPTLDPTADWKTYTSRYGYSIKYPSEWMVKTSDWKEGTLTYGLQKDDEVIIRFSEPNQPPHGGFPYGITISLKDPIGNPDKLPAINFAENNFSSKEIQVQIEPVRVANISSAKAISNFNGKNANFFIPYQEKVYRAYTNHFSESDQNSKIYDDLVDQILSTFKFLGQNQADATASWKIYSLPHFSLSLPNTWNLVENTSESESYIFSSGLPGRSELLIIKTPYKTAENLKTNIYGWSGKPPKTRQLTLGAASATEYFDCIGIEGCMDMYILIINDAGTFYQMKFTPYPDQPSGLYQQILSTFRFN